MKACKNLNCKFSGFELSSVVKFCAYFDIIRLILFHGILIMIFVACTNVNPMYPEGRKVGKTVDYVLYNGSRANLTVVEQIMLANVEKSCGREYRNGLPEIWIKARPVLIKSISYLAAAIILPVITASTFLIFYKKDRKSSYIAVTHFITQGISAVLSVFGAWFVLDTRLCFLGAFDKTYNVQAMICSTVLGVTIIHKAGLLYSLHLYLVHHYKSRNLYAQTPTPEEELKTYLKELRALGITPKVVIELPQDPGKVSWNFINSQIKKALQDVRIQVARLHKDDPMVSALLFSGKLTREGGDRRKKGGSASSTTAPSMLKIAQMMKEGGEYKLLKQHHSSRRSSRDTEGSGRDDVEIILPEPGSRKAF